MRIVFERPQYTKWLIRGAFAVLAGVVLWCALSPASIEVRMVLGLCVVLFFGPFILLGWFRVGQRIELDESGVTMRGRIRSKHYSWHDVAAERVRYPLHYWNDKEIAMPPDLADVEPAFDLPKPMAARATWTPLQRATYQQLSAFGKTEWTFELREALTYVRSREPEGDWRRQAAAVFTARDRDGLGPKRALAADSSR